MRFLEDKKQSQEAGMNEHLSKPLDEKKVDEYDLEIYARKATIIIAGWKKSDNIVKYNRILPLRGVLSLTK